MDYSKVMIKINGDDVPVKHAALTVNKDDWHLEMEPAGKIDRIQTPADIKIIDANGREYFGRAELASWELNMDGTAPIEFRGLDRIAVVRSDTGESIRFD